SVRKAFFKYENGIRLALTKPYSNGRLENLHTHIKTLKRVAFGKRCSLKIYLPMY
ncbi:transposase, partial [Enterococcus sp. BWB1-3]|uniref:transposase n=1 Tax=Enterococcus sp. BWB1-3 TaxID=2787713 RepID=UPI001923BC8D